ncbi:hypothetical protein B0T14DRAFT_512497 [Immersiella caudata]|uniref:Uncharacterized protein n=1 Tax=Immersiella caudata TaxID=314043 RepID=A0AA40C712_9PEZI|nr:hypothetical protein B0T14DRAFT_512497 [Immersiella caudata]
MLCGAPTRRLFVCQAKFSDQEVPTNRQRRQAFVGGQAAGPWVDRCQKEKGSGALGFRSAKLTGCLARPGTA